MTDATQAPDVAAAHAQVETLKADPAFMVQWHANEGDARAKLNSAIERANPGETDSHGQSIGLSGQAPGVDFDAPPETPQHYKLDYAPGHEVDRAFDSEARGFYHAAGFDQATARLVHNEHARHANEEATRLEATGQHPTEAALELKARTVAAQLRGLWGEENVDRKLDGLDAFFKALPADKRAWWHRHIDRTPGGLGNVRVVARLADLGEAILRKAKA